MDGAGQEVRRRRVFYIPGYDPIHPRRYRELYRKEGAAQAEISGYEVALSPRESTAKGHYGWHVNGRMEGAEIAAEFEVLVWSDIVRDSMAQGILSTYAQLLRTSWIYIGSGALFRLMRLRKGPVIAALYPVVFLLVQALVALAAGWAVFTLIDRLLGFLPGASETAVALAGGIGIAYGIADWFRRQDGRFFAYYLMHDFAHSAALKGAYSPDLQRRMAEFAATISEALREDLDEVLVVGHSSGAHLGASILADLIRQGGVPAKGPRLGFLTLGQVVPMVSFLPDAEQLRADLHFLSARDELTWVDVTAPGDGCAFALCDPVAVTGVAPEGKRWPLVISAAFTQTLSPERWKELRWRFFRLHFQYLCAFDRPGDYDYFRITAGPVSLATRFEGRAPSRSRLETAVSKYTSMAA